MLNNMLNNRSVISLAILVASIAAMPGVGAPAVPVIAASSVRAGMITVTVTNTHTASITGLLLQSMVSEATKRRAIVSSYLDIFVNASYDKPIAPGESRAISIINAALSPGGPPPTVLSGALFADGSSVGTSQGIHILEGRRTELAQTLIRFRQRMMSLKGAGLPEVLASTNAQAQEEGARVRGMRPEEMPIAGVSSMVSDWVQSALASAPANCSADCAGRRLDYIVAGLSTWSAKLTEGMPSKPVN